ncbi:MAG: hypothetical protein H7323_01115 [Frankiales bacterium]|nr:hypothetical protein [Frankiales bacterium]
MNAAADASGPPVTAPGQQTTALIPWLLAALGAGAAVAVADRRRRRT